MYFAETIGTMEQAFQFAQIILSRGIVIKVLSQEILWKYKIELRWEQRTKNAVIKLVEMVVFPN